MKTHAEFANDCLPESNWSRDEWKSRRAAIEKLVAARDAEVRRSAIEEAVTAAANYWNEHRFYSGAGPDRAEAAFEIEKSLRALAGKDGAA